MSTAVAPAPRIRSVRCRPAAAGRVAVAVGAALAGAAWAALCFAPDLSTSPLVAACMVAVTAGLAVAAAVVAAQPGRRWAGSMLAAAALVWPVNSLGGWDVGIMIAVRHLGEAVFWVILLVAVLTYQHPRLARYERLFVGWIALQLVGGQIYWTLISRPEWAGEPAGVWWPSIAQDRALFETSTHVLGALYIPSALLFAAIVFARWRRIAPVDRYSIAPVVMAVVVAGVAAGVSWSTYEQATVVVAVVVLPLPAAFVYSATRLSGLRRRLAEALAATPTSRVVEPGDAPDVPEVGVAHALRTVLRDPTLTVTFWSAQHQEWVDETGRPCGRRATTAGRIEIPVAHRDDRLRAVVGTVATSSAARREVEAAVRLCATAIENAGLRALVRAHAEAMGRAHARILATGVEERRRLEQDLHDGAQQRLLGVLTVLSLARYQAGDSAAADTVARADADVREALAELRDLAHGLHPSVLTRDGLASALTELTTRLPVPVDLRVDVGRMGAPVETSVYFVVCEALANVHKHARADRAWVRVAPGAGGLEVEVCDDGVGGADPEGHGMRGMTDRVVALGGRLTVASAPGTGTRVRAWLPCG